MSETFTCDEKDVDAITLAIAHLAAERPRWEVYLRGLGMLFGRSEMFEEFRALRSHTPAPKPAHKRSPAVAITYELSPDEISIKCLGCGVTSQNSDDVLMFYCGKCRSYHERADST